MNAAPSETRDIFERIRDRIAASRFLTFSLFVHAIIIVLAGSVVLFRATEEPPDFQSDSGGLIVDAGTPDLPQDSASGPEMKEFTPPTPSVAAPLLPVLATTAQVPNWSVNTGADAQARGIANSIKGSLASLGGGAGNGTGFGAGELGRLNGMRTATIFGKKVTAAKLGVILDVSYSAHRHLAGAVTEIQKGFKDATIILYPGCGLTDFGSRSGHEIRKFSSITKKEIEKNGVKMSTLGMLTAALKIEDFESMTKRPSVKEHLFVSWFDGEGGRAGLISRTQVAFDELIKHGVDSIYWFADFRDAVQAPVVEKLSSDLAKRKITLHVHNFAGQEIKPLVTAMAENSGGTVNTEKPQ